MATATTADRDLPVLSGAAAGAAAYLLGYLLAFLLTSGDVRESGLNRITEAVTGEPTTWKIVGWVFYNAHFVETVVNVDVPVLGSRTGAVNLIAGGGALTPLLYVVPALLLVGAGIAVGRRRLDSTDPVAAVLAGATTAVGYLPLVVAGAFLFRVSAGGSLAGPTLVTAVLLAGLVYPVVFGPIGALIAQRT